MTYRNLFLLCITALFFLACSDRVSQQGSEPVALLVPTSGRALGPRLSGGGAYDLLLSWMAPHSNGATLLYSRFGGGSWGAANSVVDIPSMFVNWADLPSVVPLGDGHIAAHWLERRAAGGYAYDVLFTQSSDNGVTWSEATRPHTDGTDTEHGFVSIYPDGPHTGLIWLDGRNMANADTNDQYAHGMTLRTAKFGDDSSPHGEQIIDNLVCDCCQTDVAMSSSGPVAVYRNRSREEIRDIYVARYIEDKWQPGHAIADDGWQIDACPVNGPAIDSMGQYVAIAWFNAADAPVVRFSLSIDGGESFSSPLDIGSDNALGRVGIALLDDGRAAVSWMQSVEGAPAKVLVRQVADGKLGPVRTVTSSAKSLSVPQMGVAGSDLIFVWSETMDDEQRIVSTKLPFAALSALAD